MARAANQKKKLPVIAGFLLRNSDEEHPVSTARLLEELGKWDITAERKSIYDDMEQLRQLGMDVQLRKGRDGGWFVGQREFQLAELKLLVDAVASSRFLTQRKSDALIHKLESLASAQQARQLQRQVYVDRRAKTMNEHIFYNVDKLHTAISDGKMVTFFYFEYNMRKQKVYRRGGERYRVTPLGLIWDSENYYLAGWDEIRQDLRHYRVDKMDNIVVTAIHGSGRKEWDPEGYARRHFGMYAGRACRITLRCAASLAGVVLDRFGQETMLIPDGADAFTVTVELVVSPPFWGWLFGLGAGVTVTAPQWAAQEFQRRLEELLRQYRDGES